MFLVSLLMIMSLFFVSSLDKGTPLGSICYFGFDDKCLGF